MKEHAAFVNSQPTRGHLPLSLPALDPCQAVHPPREDDMHMDAGPVSGILRNRGKNIMLNFFKSFFARVADYFISAEEREREAWLAESTDIFDLERRMRELDQGSHAFRI
jgi:hypothetical protein